MAKTKQHDKVYLKALRKLRKLISEEYEHGGRLPSHRVMCEKLGVSLVTYTKAIKCLIEDNTIAKAGGRGGTHIAPAFARCKKIGVIIGSGGESPFLGDSNLFNGLTQTLKIHGYHVQFLQSPLIENIQDKAIQYGVEGIVWLQPNDRVIPIMKQIHQDGQFPLVVPGGLPDLIEALSDNDIPIVTSDRKHVGKIVAKTLSSLNHRSMIYVGKFEILELFDCVEAFKKSNMPLSPEHCVDIQDIQISLLDKLKALGATCIFAGGGPVIYHQIIEQISILPENKRPALLFRGMDPLYSHTLEKKIKLIGRSYEDSSALGQYAAEMLVERMTKGEPLVSTFLPVSRIA